MDPLKQTDRYVYVKAQVPRELYEALLEKHQGHVRYVMRDLRLHWECVMAQLQVRRVP